MGDRLEVEQPTTSFGSFVDGSAACAADILALSRAALEAIQRALRAAPEVRENRLMARSVVELEEVLFELAPTESETSLGDLAGRLGVGVGPVRSTALRLQRMGLLSVTDTGVSLSGQGRQKLARLEMAQAKVLRRILEGMDARLSESEARQVIVLLTALLDRAETLLEPERANA